MVHHKTTPLMALVLAGCTEAAAPGDAIADRLTTALFQQHLDAVHAAGVVGVMGEMSDEHGSFQAHSGVARLGSDLPVTSDSHVRIGSNTKTFVAVVVLQLAQEGVLDLDDSVDQWLPALVSGNGNDGTQITIRDLLRHTSGLSDYTQEVVAEYTPDGYPMFRATHYDPEQLVAIALQRAPLFAPGTSFSYSNTNYVLAGMIIRQATGRDWGSEVDARIVAPLRLSNTFAPLDELDLPEPHANGYHEFAEDGPLLDVTLMNHTVADAAGALVSTTSDLLEFWRALEGGRLLGEAEMAEMHDTVPVDAAGRVRPGSRYGLGIIWYPTSCGGGYWHHQGDTLGFSVFNAVSDDRTRTVVVAQTTTPGGAAVDAEDLKLLDEMMCADR